MGLWIRALACLPLITHSACLQSWKWDTSVDADGDGFSAFDGDCDDSDPEVGPHAAERWYDGVDQDCDGGDDYDADGDGFTSAAHGGEDCHDDAPEAYPGSAAEEVFYDCVDQDCDGNDGDQDGDGYLAEGYELSCEAWQDIHPEAQLGDCWDDPEADFDAEFEGEEAARPVAAEVHPDAAERWYDGVDQDCAGDDFDQDGDGYARDEECDDTDPLIFPSDTPEIWYDCVDQNCDGNDGDQDGDSYVALTFVDGDGVEQDYAAACPDWESLNPQLEAGDCWDAPGERPEVFTAVNGFPDPAAGEVHPDGRETWYDGVDQDCQGDDDFDADRDFWPTDAYRDRAGAWGLDCQDQDPDANPGAYERCETAYDDDCDGQVNEVGAWDGADYYRDQDGDGYGDDTSVRRTQCGPDAASGYTTLANGDCDDGDSATHPGAAEVVADGIDQDCDGADDCYVDADGDGFGAASAVSGTSLSCDRPSAGLADDADDCDDGDSGVHPDAAEVCNGGVDDDCDGLADDDDSDVDASTGATFYVDNDGDGFGEVGSTMSACSQPTGYVADDSDCDDGDNNINPGASEICDGDDNDCDGDVDDDDASVTGTTTYYADSDGDGYGDASSTTDACDTPSGYVADANDCDDSVSDINPDADEICDGDDNDCDGDVDDDDASLNYATASTWYGDNDGDGYGDSASTTEACDQPSGYTSDDTDCDDTDPNINPGADEVCDSSDTDEDCDGSADDDDSNVDPSTLGTWYADDDGDGYGDPSNAAQRCDASWLYVADDTDCDDSDATVNPGEVETDSCFDGRDNNCDGFWEEGCYTTNGGELIISEIFYNSSSDHAWFELVNESGGDLDLYGMELVLWDASLNSGAGGELDSFIVDDAVYVSDGSRAVLCKQISNSQLGGDCDFEFDSVSVNGVFDVTASDDLALILYDHVGVDVDTVDYYTLGTNSWPNLGNDLVSIELCEDQLDPLANDDGGSWEKLQYSNIYRYYNTSGSVNDRYGTPGYSNSVGSCN